jgi:hypothetical protein
MSNSPSQPPSIFAPSETILPFERLDDLAYEYAEDYQNGAPFPHILFDDLFPLAALEQLVSAFPAPKDDLGWRRAEVELDGEVMQYNKLGMPHEMRIDPIIRQLLWEMQSGAFVQFLENLTGIKGLLTDPCMQGGGVHQSLRGGSLGIHADFTEHKVYKLNRRLNVLLYLNKDWKEAYGGHLELWSRDMSSCERRIMPSLGRCVIFNTDADSFHGHPQILDCPDDVTRKSIALYYYTNGRDDKNVASTKTTGWRSSNRLHLPPVE